MYTKEDVMKFYAVLVLIATVAGYNYNRDTVGGEGNDPIVNSFYGFLSGAFLSGVMWFMWAKDNVVN
jgi:hypothetical protein